MNLPLYIISRHSLLCFFLIILCYTANAQEQQQQQSKKEAVKYPQKTLQTLRITEPPKIDGVLDEAI